MPKSSFSTSNVRSSGTSFPKLKLQAMGEHARIKLAEAAPTFEWVHTLRRPKLSPVTGQLLLRTIEVGKGDNKEKKEVPDMDFVGTPICFGNLDALEDSGLDTDHCPICRSALEYPDYFARPDRKWAVHVFRYATKGNTTAAQEPLQFEVKVWTMSENRYGRVVSVLEEFAPSAIDQDPLKVDLTLGPCNNVGFQNYEIQGSPRCALAENPKKWTEAEEVFAANHVEDLSPYCGRKADPRFVKNDIDEIINKWSAARRGGTPVEEPNFAATLSNSQLDRTPAASPPAAPLSALDDSVGAGSEDKPAAQAPTAPPVSTPSFASLMDSIGVAPK